MKKVNITIGRFQPFTKGHMKCIDKAWDELRIPTVIIMIETPENKTDERHPFPSDMLVPLYKKLFKKDGRVEDIVLSKNANIVEIGEKLQLLGYKIQSWSCGTDRYDSYKKMSDKYKDKAGLDENFEMLEIKRTDEDISATKVRQALIDGDKKSFLSMTPAISLSASLSTNYYEDLRKQILKVYKKE